MSDYKIPPMRWLPTHRRECGLSTARTSLL
jgi:hypothetical protein